MMDLFYPNHLAKAYKYEYNKCCVSNDDKLFVYLPKIIYNYIKQIIYIGHVLIRNRLLKHSTEGKIEGKLEVTRRLEGRCKQLLDDLRADTGYFKLKNEALDRPL
jgi:hypothetical protein